MYTGQITLHQTQENDMRIENRLANETVWPTADLVADLSQRKTASRHSYSHRNNDKCGYNIAI